MKLPFNLSVSFSKKELFRFGAPVAVLALIASVVVGRERPADVPAEPAARVDTRIQASDQDFDLSKLARDGEPAPAPAANPFARRNFGQAQGAPAAAAPAGAPPLPFKYLGKAIEDGKLSVFLASGDKTYSVHAGQKERLENDYRVDKVTESGISFTYLPMKTRQTLDIPAVN
jgi:hypothetical protein